MEKQILKSVHFKQLKCLNDVTIYFSDTLTAIMGVNGAGKTTVIHALACVYQPDDGGKGENHKFPEFFVPNTDSLWRGSELYVVNETEGKNGQRVVLPSRRYGKTLTGGHQDTKIDLSEMFIISELILASRKLKKVRLPVELSIRPKKRPGVLRTTSFAILRIF